jgi:hypothetical protein
MPVEQVPRFARNDSRSSQLVRRTRTGREYEGTFLVPSCVDLATQLAKYVMVVRGAPWLPAGGRLVQIGTTERNPKQKDGERALVSRLVWHGENSCCPSGLAGNDELQVLRGAEPGACCGRDAGNRSESHPDCLRKLICASRQ